jgi:hypothetical protein
MTQPHLYQNILKLSTTKMYSLLFLTDNFRKLLASGKLWWDQFGANPIKIFTRAAVGLLAAGSSFNRRLLLDCFKPAMKLFLEG